jgi:hypothetical protein
MLVLGIDLGSRVALDIPGYPRMWIRLRRHPDDPEKRVRVAFDLPREIGVWREAIAPEREAEPCD